MKIRSIAIAATIAASLALPVAAQTVGIITSPAGTTSHSAGSAIAKTLGDAGVRAIVQAQATTGFEEVLAGGAEFNLSNSFDSTYFVTGTGQYSGKGAQPGLVQVGVLMPYRVAIHVRANSNIRTMADLKGKSIPSDFKAQPGIAQIIAAHLANAGLTYDDVKQVPAPNVARAAEDFVAGKVDVLFFAIGTGAVKQAAASVGGLRVLPLDVTPKAVARMQEALPGSYLLNVKAQPNLEGIDGAADLVAFDMVMNTRSDVSDTVVYKVAKALHENKKALAASFPAFNQFDPARMATPVKGMKMHPGAKRYYEEVGLVK
ncbi:MAG: TAXI family TRAP transporter solute-binding subunit [Bryobacteraceae bacterium]|nr:TAXI family TRAP transporter solute-binding subunit [Bryobacteraceae bacterium]